MAEESGLAEKMRGRIESEPRRRRNIGNDEGKMDSGKT